MLKKILAFLLTVILLCSLCGCDFLDKIMNSGSTESESSEPEPVLIDPNYPVTVAGKSISAKPEKVAVISPSLAEYISDMGMLDRICAVGDFCDFSKEAEKIERIGSVMMPDFDALSTLSPDYILSFSAFDETSLIKIQQMNITVLNFTVPGSIDELCSLYKELAMFFMGEVDGSAYGETYAETYLSAYEQVKYDGEKANVCFLRSLDNVMITSDSMAGELLGRCFINAAGDATGFEYPMDKFDELKPDFIFVGGRLRLRDLETSDLYKKKTPVKKDRVYLADLDAISLCSLRSFAIVRDMMTTVYEDYTLGTKLEIAYPSIYE